MDWFSNEKSSLKTPEVENPDNFLNVLKTPQQDGVPDDWQPWACITRMYQDGKISIDD